jgi:DNA polymerase I - 3''-5'' exonuclease and polymerase domains
MRLVIDIETNSLSNPTQLWVVVCKDIDKKNYHIFREVLKNEDTKRELVNLLSGCTVLVGHNLCGYDLSVLNHLLPDTRGISCTTYDTLIISKLVDYSRSGHSVEDYGREFGLEKGKFNDFSKYSKEMEDYCIRDVDITERIFTKYSKYIHNPLRASSIHMEHDFQLVCNKLEKDGFAFNKAKAEALLAKIQQELLILDEAILSSFPPKLKLIREITPKGTKHGTISLTSIPSALRESIADFTIGAPFSYCAWTEFNPSSHKQIIGILSDAGWKPTDRTKTHIDTERELQKLKRTRGRNKELDLRIETLHTKLNDLKITGWKVNETNLDTLSAKAPASARTIAKRILLESRRRTLTEWLALCRATSHNHERIHGKFYGIGAWTHRMAHQNPNTANIPNEYDTKGNKKLYGKELRSLWVAPKGRLLVGCDAEGIQLRIFAHYIDDKEFTHELLNGDPHSLNQSILGAATRDAAKRYIYALLLGAGQGKLQEILGCDLGTATKAYERLLARYEGFAHLKETVIPADAKRGWFVGLDGRAVRIPSETVGGRRHLCMSGYLQNGEAVVMKRATLKWWHKLPELDAMLVDMVHDEWQTECPNNMEIALRIANMQADSLRQVGEELKLRCPLAGSFWNKKAKDYTIDTNWSKTH